MIVQKISDLIFTRVDFENDELEALVEAQTQKSALAIEAAIKMENIILAVYSDDPEAQGKAAEIAEGIVDFASEIGSAFPSLSPTQVERFKTLFATVFESPSEPIEQAGEALFNASVDTLQAIQALVTYVNTPA